MLVLVLSFSDIFLFVLKKNYYHYYYYYHHFSFNVASYIYWGGGGRGVFKSKYFSYTLLKILFHNIQIVNIV